MKQEIDCTSASGELRVRVESLPFSEIPGQSKLFLDFIADPAALARFYPTGVTTHSDVALRIPDVLAGFKVDRERLADALKAQNILFGAGSLTLENIELLRRPGTVAVLTGQQAGLMTGPLYTIYKALSAVKMAVCLNDRGFDAVPVFWAATEDHDFDEVSIATVAAGEGNLVDVRHIPEKYSEKMPVGKVELDGSVGEAINELFSTLPQTEFTAEITEIFENAYRPGATFGSSFASLISRIAAGYGLIVVDPLDLELKRLASPIYVKAVENAREIVTAVIERGRELADAGYHVQVAVGEDYYPFFLQDEEGRRTTLKFVDGDSVGAVDSRTKITPGELKDLAVNSPERLSPGVMLRPVVQDYLFPTVCYFGGGAEIAYFAQNRAVYDTLRRPVTPILHRQSFTIVEARFSRTMEKLGLELIDLLGETDGLRSDLVARVIDPGTAKLFADVEEKVNTELHRLDEALSAIDLSLASAFAKRRRKMMYHIAATHKNFERTRLAKDEVVDRQLRAALANLAPRGALQERSINVAQFLDRYGMYFIEWVYRSIDLSDSGHRVIYL